MASTTPRRRPLALRLLVAAALAVVGVPVLSTPRGPQVPDVRSRQVAVPDGRLGPDAVRIDVPGGPELIALTWADGSDADFEVRALDDDGWSDWFHLHGAADEAPDLDSGEHAPTGAAGPAFLGRDIASIEVRAEGTVPPGVVVHAIDAEPATPASGVAEAAAPAPGLVTRAQWGADEGWRDDAGGECDGVPKYVDNIKVAVVHHTVSRNDYTPAESAAILRGIYDFHVHSRGYCDVAYNFLVDRFGQIFEGRFGGIRRAVIGGHASGINSASTGVAVIGDHTTVAPSPETYQALVEVLAFKLAYHGVSPTGSSSVTIGSNSSARWPSGTTVTLPNILGHQDSNNTSCPGELLYAKLPQLRTDVAQVIAGRGLQPALTLARIADADRFATAGAVASSTFSSAARVFLARGEGATSFADALAANYLGGLAPAPTLLSNATNVPAATTAALQRLGTQRVTLLGGEQALSPAVEQAVRTRGLEVDRIGGADRYVTAALVARTGGFEAVGVDGQGRRTAVLSSGTSFPDALAAGGLVYARHFPQLLSPADALPEVTASALRDLAIAHVLITGGPAALSPAVEQAVQALGISTERVAGGDRYATAAALADLSVDRYGFAAGNVAIATGESFPDALTGGSYAGRSSAPILLTPRLGSHPDTCGYLQRRAGALVGGQGRILGGPAAVDPSARWSLQECIAPT